MTIFWEKTGNLYSLQRLSIAFDKDSISIDAKDFYACNECFGTVTEANVIALYIHKSRYINYKDLTT